MAQVDVITVRVHIAWWWPLATWLAFPIYRVFGDNGLSWWATQAAKYGVKVTA